MSDNSRLAFAVIVFYIVFIAVLDWGYWYAHGLGMTLSQLITTVGWEALDGEYGGLAFCDWVIIFWC